MCHFDNLVRRIGAKIKHSVERFWSVRATNDNRSYVVNVGESARLSSISEDGQILAV